LNKLPLENFASKYPQIVKKWQLFCFCKNFKCLPCSGGAYNQFADDYIYFEIFSGEIIKWESRESRKIKK